MRIHWPRLKIHSNSSGGAKRGHFQALNMITELETGLRSRAAGPGSPPPVRLGVVEEDGQVHERATTAGREPIFDWTCWTCALRVPDAPLQVQTQARGGTKSLNLASGDLFSQLVRHPQAPRCHGGADKQVAIETSPEA